MKEINSNEIDSELVNLNVGEASRQLIMNNISLYNNLIRDYNSGITKNLYLTYQLNVQIFKQLTDLKKLNKHTDKNSEVDGFEKLMSAIKPNIEVR